jgi:macrodomain Ter protein organizer (MatP/YcbG family)
VVTRDLEEQFTEQKITYVLETEGQLFMIENVPARVSETTGEQLFSPATVERLQQMVRAKQKPVRILETPVYEFAA